MNPKFFLLPPEKQRRILSAAYRVFSQNSYRRAPMSEIAAEAGISKALLFHYFVNKKELYLYLWEHAVDMTRQATIEYRVLETGDLFEMLRRSLAAKCALMRRYPHVCAFTLNAYYESQPEIRQAVQASYAAASQDSEQKVFARLDPTAFQEDGNRQILYQEILYAMEGYMLGVYRTGQIDPDKIERECGERIAFWETIYRKQED